jgi:peroxiredoxin
MKLSILKSAAFCLLAFLLACSEKESPTPTQPTPASETWVAYPDFQLLDPDGKSYKLSAYKGKVIVLNFFATWCGPCRSETPELKTKIWEAYKDRNVVVLGINLQETSDLVKQWAAQYGLTFPLLLDAKGEVGRAYQVNAIPHNVIIDKDFKIYFTQTGYYGNLNDLIAKIESLL